MTGTIKKRVLSLLMALSVLFSAMVTLDSVGVDADASQPTTKSEVISRLDAIAKKYNGWNYSVMVKETGTGYYYGDGDCFSFTKTVFEQVFGLLAFSSYKDNHYEIWNTNPRNQQVIVQVENGQCAGANTPEISKNALSQAKPGDIIIGKLSKSPHIMVVYSANANGLKILDCNNDTHNTVLLRDESYETFSSRYSKFTLYRAVNYPADKPEVAPVISAPKTQGEVKARLDNIIKGEYGDGKTFPYSNSPVPVRLGGTEGDTGTLGYARYAFYQMFGKPLSTGVKSNVYELTNSNGNLKVIASCSGTSTAAQMKADVLNTRPGDIIQGKGNGFYQTMIVYSYDENSITLLDCDNDYKCGIQLRTRDWARFSGSFKQYTIYRAADYPEPKPTVPDTSKPSTTKKGDINGDGKTNMADVTALLTAVIMGKTTDLQKYDFNGDGKVGFADVSALLAYVVSL